MYTYCTIHSNPLRNFILNTGLIATGYYVYTHYSHTLYTMSRKFADLTGFNNVKRAKLLTFGVLRHFRLRFTFPLVLMTREFFKNYLKIIVTLSARCVWPSVY